MGVLRPIEQRAPAAALIRGPTIRERLRARVGASALDRELANGVPEQLSRPLELRASVLLQRSVRRRLGDQLRQIVREAHEPARLSLRVPIRRRQIVGMEGQLRLLASRLDSSYPVAVRGVAKISVLLTDGCGPLYYGDSTEDLDAALQQALAALS